MIAGIIPANNPTKAEEKTAIKIVFKFAINSIPKYLLVISKIETPITNPSKPPISETKLQRKAL